MTEEEQQTNIIPHRRNENLGPDTGQEDEEEKTGSSSVDPLEKNVEQQTPSFTVDQKDKNEDVQEGLSFDHLMKENMKKPDLSFGEPKGENIKQDLSSSVDLKDENVEEPGPSPFDPKENTEKAEDEDPSPSVYQKEHSEDEENGSSSNLIDQDDKINDVHEDPSSSIDQKEKLEVEIKEEEGVEEILLLDSASPSSSVQNAEEETQRVQNPSLKSCIEDWEELDKEYSQLEEIHRTYQKRLAEMSEVQQKCIKQIAHHRYRVKKIQDTLKRNIKDKELNPEDRSDMKELQRRLVDRKEIFRELEESLPHKNGLYLSIILGQVNVSLLNKDDKFKYKQEYERFKLVVSYIVMGLSFTQTFFGKYRWVDSILHFLLVWYYCTLTIRESILVVNGSRIKGWWMTHHFVSTVAAGISLIWPDGWSYQIFRTQYVLFILYLSFVYIVQCYYQNGCLYRLRTLGKRHGMDITVEGFMSWMWKGLAFLLPLLFFGYFFQTYNAYVLWNLTYDARCTEWQVCVLSVITFGLAFGNFLTTLWVIRDKLKKDGYISYTNSRNKYGRQPADGPTENGSKSNR